MSAKKSHFFRFCSQLAKKPWTFAALPKKWPKIEKRALQNPRGIAFFGRFS